MKLYILTIDEIWDYKRYSHTPEIKLAKKDAIARLRELKKRAKDNLAGKDVKVENGETSFSIFKDGYEAESHYTVTVDEVEVPNIVPTGAGHVGKFGLKIIFGEDLSRYACNFGFIKARKALDKGEIDGSGGEYFFDTEKDRENAKEILEQHDGWLGNYYECK